MSKTRVLFVDDEVNIIEGLQRMLRRQRNEWEMVFVTSAGEALACMDQTPFDVVVTDIQMPGIHGGELLENIMERHPEVARIVLSGHVDETVATRVLKLAHQFLNKPTDAQALKQAVARACTARESVNSDRIRLLAAGVGTLPSPPDLYVRITQAAAEEDASVHDIAAVIAQDPAVSAKILQLVNSSFFGLGRRVSNIDQAITLLGLARVKSLVLSSQIVEQFRPKLPVAGFSIERLMRRTAMTAQFARLISRAEAQNDDRQTQAFTSGLLHDVGLLIMASRQPEALREVLKKVQEQGAPLCLAEGETFGATHADLGAYLLELWGLPPRIVEGIALHHEPMKTAFNGLSSVTAVHVAAALLPELCEADAECRLEAPFAPKLDAAYLTRIGRGGRVEAWKQLIVSKTAQAEVPSV
jgi:HD-like signal output (HDOD) protein